MPTYVYRRADGTRFEHQQRITADALDVCPTTGQTVTRVPSASAGLVFKGSGFYQTDYVRSSGGTDKGPSETPASSTGSESTGASAAAAAPAPAAPAAPSSGAEG